MGQKMSAESAATLQQSILRIGNEETRAIFQLLAVKPMQRARYFSTGDHKDDRQRWRHFALNVDLYTHFTSPIRRYADVIVHRLLQMALDEDAGEIIAPAGQQREQQKALAEISLTARQCNLKKEDARAAQDASSKLFLCVYLRRLEQSTNRPIICDAVVMDFGGERGMDVYVPQFALDRRVFLDDCGVAKVSMSSARDRVTLHWLSGGARRPLPPYPKPNRSDNKPPAAVQDSQTGDLVTVINGGDTGGVVQSIRLLDHVFVRLSVEGRSPMDVKVYLVHPDHSSVGQAKRHQFAVNSAANIAAAQRGSSSVLEETFVDVD
jgi:hypothetical protein